MNERNYSLGDTFKVALECEIKAIALERQHAKRNAALMNQVESMRKQHTQLHTTANSHNNLLQWLINIKLLTTNQPPRIAPATAMHL